MNVLYSNLMHALEKHAFHITQSDANVFGEGLYARKKQGRVLFRQLNAMDYMLTFKNVHDPALLKVEARLKNLFYYGIRVSEINDEFYAHVFSSDLGFDYSQESSPSINDFVLFCTVDSRKGNTFPYIQFLGEWIHQRCLSRNSFSTCIKLKIKDVQVMFTLLMDELKNRPKVQTLSRPKGSRGLRLIRIGNQWVMPTDD